MPGAGVCGVTATPKGDLALLDPAASMCCGTQALGERPWLDNGTPGDGDRVVLELEECWGGLMKTLSAPNAGETCDVPGDCEFGNVCGNGPAPSQPWDRT